jgi:pantoate--beta-alanine ligase
MAKMHIPFALRGINIIYNGMTLPMQISIADNLETLQKSLVLATQEGKSVALVPTMGALHQGHAALIRHAGSLADVVVVSIFVNPTQFGPNEDFARYPRTLEDDAHIAQEAGASFIYAPQAGDLYPEGYSTTVSAGPLGTVLCGAFRPGHFDGVATVVTKLLLRILPHVAVFGEKDYQQLCVIRRVVEDLDIPVDIVASPTVRELDGLALSSRNRYLSDKERKTAPQLREALATIAREVLKGADVQMTISKTTAELIKNGFNVEYISLCDAQTLAPATTQPARLLAAAWLGNTRLIDNIPLE